MKLIDSHAHLDLLKDAPGALGRAQQAGVVHILTIGVDLASSQRAAQFSRHLPQVSCSVGLHPHEAAAAGPELWAELKRLALTAPAVAIGECGLDFYRDLSPRARQREAFQRQVELALELGLPLVVHDRQAHEEVLAILQRQGAARVGGVLHCFSGGPDLAREVLTLGFHLGVTGVITYKQAEVLRQVVREAPLERLLIETDCPYLTPAPLRGKPNEPAYLLHTLEALALALGRPAVEVAAATTASARRLFGLPPLED
ncbi:MAG: TatD family deoxyribonuclease [Desulfarculus sp.]|nr:MAG: TatD family deoxyribonuclease [Desulfarculus sp.]